MPRITDPRIANATAPLPAGAPSAADAREGERYALIEAATHRLERDGPAAVDWPAVARTAEAYLAAEAKDLTVAAWMAVALARTEGLRGVATGFAVLRDLAETSWDTLYPPVARARARQGALGWLADAIGPQIPNDGPADAAASAAEDLAALDSLLTERLPPDGVAFTEARRRLRAICAAAVAQAAAVPPPTPPPARAAPPPPPADPAQRMLAMREEARRVALAMLETQPADPRPYALLRAVTWIEVTATPPETDGTTQVPPPPEDQVEQLAGLAEPAALILSLERLCSDAAMFWLDGQRLSHAALCERGTGYAACAEAVRLGVRALLARLPRLPDLAFSDGRPFADDETRAWIHTVIMTEPATGAVAIPPWQEGAAAARALAASGKREEALALLEEAARAAPDGRSRFHWRMAEGRHCLDSGQPLVALSLAREMDECIARHALEAWEPDVVRDALRLQYDCIVTKNSAMMPPDADRTTARDALLARLARLDPVLVARLAGSFRKPH